MGFAPLTDNIRMRRFDQGCERCREGWGKETSKLVEPKGFEPSTFPVSPGRAHQLLDEPTVLLFLDM
jgi:hypothetical protein